MDQEKLIENWLKDELSPAEQKAFEQLDDFHLNHEIIEGAKMFKASNFSQVPSYEEFRAKLPEKTTVVEKPSRVIRLNTFMRVAAAVVLSLGVYFTFFTDNETTMEALAANQTTFDLPDASTVVLNAASTISYNKDKWSDKREVSLEGEAYFKVAKGAKFDVITNDGIVSVLGTEFTVNNRDDYYEVKCFEGIVQVKTKGVTERLTQGKSLRVVRNNLSLAVIDKTAPDWIDNKSSFKSVPLNEVLNELERQYNISITLKDVDASILFTGGFVNNNLEQALESITVPLDLSVKKNNSTNITLYK